MNSKNYVLNIFFLLCFCVINSQEEAVLCSPQKNILWIGDTVNLPSITNNNDGTITLTFIDEDITDIFANYIIYDFFQSYPNTSETLEDYYTISFNSKDLIVDLTANVPIDIINVQYHYNSYTNTIRTMISQELVDELAGNSYAVTKFLSTSDADPCSDCPLIDVSSDFNFVVNFSYDATNDLLHMQNNELTSCGNSISIALTGGNPTGFSNVENTLQLWETDPGTITETDFSQNCHSLESLIFSMLDISCYNQNADNIQVSIDTLEDTFQFYRPNVIFGYDTIEFSRVNLSIEEENFNKMKPYKSSSNSYLQISNLNNQIVSVDIFNSLGQSIYNTNRFTNNSLDISNFENGLYFIKVSNANNKKKVFKFILN